MSRATGTSRLTHWVPGVRVIATYRRGWLQHDLTAGVVLTALLVPQGMAYAELAGLPAVTGLYATILPLLAYFVFGPSRILVLASIPHESGWWLRRKRVSVQPLCRDPLCRAEVGRYGAGRGGGDSRR